MRYFATALLCCALLTTILVVSVPASRAQALPAYDASGQAVVEEAYAWMGTPYGAYGADCSGLTSQVFAQFGVYLPDDPAAQWSYGVASTAEAGDLVFYDEHGWGISHVGIATGYGTVIHASTYYGAVVETPMYAIPGYVGARDVTY
jgi:cell wall-associated NlpC family hydrolase